MCSEIGEQNALNRLQVKSNMELIGFLSSSRTPIRVNAANRF